jgi:L-threonylcarbamoyladenylate synthase
VPDVPEIRRQIELAVDVLRRGGTVAYPTDTVYGLGADPFNEQGVESVFRAKNRPRSLPLPLLLADVHQLTKVARDVPEIAWKLADAFLPGRLTLVLPRSAWVPAAVAGGGPTIAVRVPDHVVPVSLAERLGVPIVGTSANLSGKPSPVTADEVRRQLGEQVDLIIDGGRCREGIESTVVDVSGGVAVMVREGAIARAEIERVCGCPLAENTRGKRDSAE